MSPRLTLLLMALVMAVLPVTAATAQDPTAAPPGELVLRTPYPAVAVEAGSTATFDLTVDAPTARRVDLAVERVPDGWSATLRGGGFDVDGGTTDPGEPPAITVDVDVPADAAEGTDTVSVVADDGATTETLALTIRIAETAGGQVTLTSEFPTLEGPSDATFTFDLTLTNDTPEEVTFGLTASAPPGWSTSVRPSGESQATTATVAGGESATVTADVDPPDDVGAGTYPVTVTASGGGQEAGTELTVEVTGSYALGLTTPDQRLNAETSVGGSTEVPLVISNDGTAPLPDVTLSASPPAGWDVTFEPPAVADLPPGEVAQVVATVTAADDTIAGDYIVPMTASVPEADAAVDIRTTVQTSSAVGVLAVAVIAIALLVLAGVFRRFGRR